MNQNNFTEANLVLMGVHYEVRDWDYIAPNPNQYYGEEKILSEEQIQKILEYFKNNPNETT